MYLFPSRPKSTTITGDTLIFASSVGKPSRGSQYGAFQRNSKLAVITFGANQTEDGTYSVTANVNEQGFFSSLARGLHRNWDTRESFTLAETLSRKAAVAKINGYNAVLKALAEKSCPNFIEAVNGFLNDLARQSGSDRRFSFDPATLGKVEYVLASTPKAAYEPRSLATYAL